MKGLVLMIDNSCNKFRFGVEDNPLPNSKRQNFFFFFFFFFFLKKKKKEILLKQ